MYEMEFSFMGLEYRFLSFILAFKGREDDGQRLYLIVFYFRNPVVVVCPVRPRVIWNILPFSVFQ